MNLKTVCGYLAQTIFLVFFKLVVEIKTSEKAIQNFELIPKF